MLQQDFKKLAGVRISDAKALLNTRRNSSGAYYLAGYAVECAIKACIAKKTRKGEWPPKAEDVREMYSHDLSKLIKQAGLTGDFERDFKKNLSFAGHWGTVKEWSEQKRYEVVSQKKANELITAITDTNDGVLAWIQQYW